MKPILVILAAWLWSRYGGLKQLDGFWLNNETLIEYAVYDAVRAWFRKVVFVIRKSFEEQFLEDVVSKLSWNIEVQLAYQEYSTLLPEWYDWKHRQKPRGTWHAVLAAKDFIDWPFAVINADDYYGVDWFRQVVNLVENNCTKNSFWMIGYVLKNTLSENGTVNRWVCQLKNWKLLSVKEHHKIWKTNSWLLEDDEGNVLDPEAIVSMNFRYFDNSFLKDLETYWWEFLQEHGDTEKKEFYLPFACNRLIHEQWWVCHVSVSGSKWCGVTYHDDKEILQNHLSLLTRSWEYPKVLWS